MQRFHRLFGGEYSGSGCYIVVTAGREDSRGLGNPMTEPFPRRPRVLGSPRSVALAKEGVPPEWEPGCGAPRRRRPVGRERQPGATGHVTSGPGHRTRRGGAPWATGRAPAAGSPKARGSSPPWRECPGLPAASRDRPVGMEERLPRVRRRTDQRGREEGRCDAAHACAEVRPARYLGTTDIAHGSRARCASVSTHTAPSPSGPSRICGGRPKRSTSRMRFGPCPLPRGAPGAALGEATGGATHGSVADVVSPGSFRRGFTGCSGVSVQGRRVT